MSHDALPPGAVAWVDLTVPEADRVRDFYQQVIGWTPQPVGMGDYEDYNMTRADGSSAAGICHARGVNADLPAQWLIYITVDDLNLAAARALDLGGRLLREPTDMGSQGRYCVIEDPAGAVAALYEPARGPD
jgi:uncharacterized protein